MSIFKNYFIFFLNLIFFLLGLFFNFYFLFIFLGFFFFIRFKLKSNYLYFLISIIFFTLFLFELTFRDKISESDYITINNIDYDIDKKYGYHPAKNKIFKEEIFYKKKLIKDNTYTINEYGHRKLENKNNHSKCIIFHGGSITFGQSLDDKETLPYLTGKFFRNNYDTFNFAFNGYGPHQFLSKLENLDLEEVNNCKEVFIIYLYIHDHIARVAGKRSWGDKSPRYININNDLIQKGFFSDFPFKFIMKVRKNFRDSKVLNTIYNLEKINNEDMKIHLMILKKIENISKKRFLKTNFIYLVWKRNFNINRELDNFFKNKRLIYIDDLKIDERYKSNKIPGDNHPTKEFNIILAKEIKNLFE